MGASANLFVTVEDTREVVNIMPKVIRDLNKWQRNELKSYADLKGFNNVFHFLFRDKESEFNKHLKDFTNGCTVETRNFESFSVFFTVYGERRRLFVTHTCSNDHSEIHEGGKIIFSLGPTGLAEEIMAVVAESVKEFGDVYYTKDDCSYEFEKLN